MPDPNIFYAAIANADAVYPNGIKTFLANGFATFFVKGNSHSSNGF